MLRVHCKTIDYTNYKIFLRHFLRRICRQAVSIGLSDINQSMFGRRVILVKNQHQQETQGDVDHGGEVAEGTKELRRHRVNNRRPTGMK